MNSNTISPDSLMNDLERAGLKRGLTVMVHSSMKKIGPVSGGPETVLDALSGFFSDGLLVFPTLTYTLCHYYEPESHVCAKCAEILGKHFDEYCLAKRFKNEPVRVFDLKNTPSIVGLLPEMFRKRGGVLRSLNPTHSVAALGRDAGAFVAGHEFSKSACGAQTPWRKLLERDGKILLLGVDLTSATFLHGVTEWTRGSAAAPLLDCEFELIDADGKTMRAAGLRGTAGCSQKFNLARNDLEKASALTRFKFGDAESYILDCRAANRVVSVKLLSEPDLW